MMGRLRESKWIYVLLSVLLASVFWLYVRTDQDPPQTKPVSGVPVIVSGEQVLASQGFIMSKLSQETVTIRIEAPVSVLDRINRTNVSVTVDVSSLASTGEHSVTYKVNLPTNVNRDSVVLLDQKPEQLTVTVEKLYDETFPVEFQLKGSVAEGYQAGKPTISVESVKVSGTEEQVSQVARVVAVLETQDLKERFSGELPLRLLDAEGNELTDLDVALSDESAFVTLPVVVVKEVPLKINILPGGGATEDDIKYKIKPETITVAGEEKDMLGLNEIYLGTVDLSKIVGSKVLTFDITPDSGLENISGITQAEVSVQIEGLSTRTFAVENIEVVNVPDGYTAEKATQVLPVMIRGAEKDLESIDGSQLRVVADMSQIEAAGTFSVPVKVYLDAGGDVGVIGEYTIVVNITR